MGYTLNVTIFTTKSTKLLAVAFEAFPRQRQDIRMHVYLRFCSLM